MTRITIWLGGALLAATAALLLWLGAGGPAGSPASVGSPPATPPVRAPGSVSLPQRKSQSVPAPGDAAAGAGTDASSAGAVDPERERMLEEFADEIAALALARQGDLYVNHLVASGLARADAGQIVTAGFSGAARCSLAAMREQAQAETVPLDTVLYALQAELYDTDGPLLSGTIDLEAAGAREAPCALDALQEAGIPLAVALEIRGASQAR